MSKDTPFFAVLRKKAVLFGKLFSFACKMENSLVNEMDCDGRMVWGGVFAENAWRWGCSGLPNGF